MPGPVRPLQFRRPSLQRPQMNVQRARARITIPVRPLLIVRESATHRNPSQYSENTKFTQLFKGGRQPQSRPRSQIRSLPTQHMKMKLWWQSASLAPRRSGFDSRRLHLRASVVSTASTRPSYGRGAGSTPAGGSSHARSSADRALPCEGRGRWFDPAGRTRGCSSAGRAPGRHPERPVRAGSSASTSPWCNGSTASSNLAGPGSNPGGFASSNDRRGPERLGYLGERPSGLRFESAHPSRTPRPRRLILLRAGAVPVIAS